MITETKYIRNKNKDILKIMFFIIVILLFSFYRDIINYLVNTVHLLDEKYYKYAFNEKREISLIPIELFFKIISLLAFLSFYRIMKLKYKNTDVFSMMMILDLVLYCVGFYSYDAQRISYYFGSFNMFLFPEIANCFKGKEEKVVINILIMSLLVIYWWIFVCRHRFHETYPYYSIFS